MKTSSLLMVAGLLIAGWVVLFQGISFPETLSAGNCSQTYSKPYLEPVIGDCLFVIPCKTSWFAEHNAKADVIQCLCKSPEANSGLITEFYSNQFIRESSYRDLMETSNPVEYVCKNVKRAYAM